MSTEEFILWIVLASLTSATLAALIGYWCGKDQGRLESFEESQMSDMFAPPGVAEQAEPQRVIK